MKTFIILSMWTNIFILVFWIMKILVAAPPCVVNVPHLRNNVIRIEAIVVVAAM